SNPGTLATKSACACAVIGSSSTISTRSAASSLTWGSFRPLLTQALVLTQIRLIRGGVLRRIVVAHSRRVPQRERDREDRPAIGIAIAMPAEAAPPLPDQDKSESVSSLAPGLGFRPRAGVEERVAVLARDPGAGVGDGDAEPPVGGDEVLPSVFLLRVRDR